MPITVPHQHRQSVEASVTIKCPVEQVFTFYRDFRNLPKFLGDVMAVELNGPTTSIWTIKGPMGFRTHWTTKVTEERQNTLIRYETVTSSVMTTQWEVYFSTGQQRDETVVREVMKVPLGEFGQAALTLIGKSPAEEIPANLSRLKELLEAGKVTNTSHAVSGKFHP